MKESFVPDFWLGVQQFNQGEYYACHDTLEALWMEAIEPDKTFYQGVLQIAVALYHLQNLNWQGAVTLLGEGIYRLRHYQPDYGEVDVTDLIQHSHALLNILQQAGAQDVGKVLHQLNQDRLDGVAELLTIRRKNLLS